MNLNKPKSVENHIEKLNLDISKYSKLIFTVPLEVRDIEDPRSTVYMIETAYSGTLL